MRPGYSKIQAVTGLTCTWGFHMFVCIQVYMNVCVFMFLHVCLRVCMFVGVYMGMHVYVCMYMYVSLYR